MELFLVLIEPADAPVGTGPYPALSVFRKIRYSAMSQLMPGIVGNTEYLVPYTIETGHAISPCPEVAIAGPDYAGYIAPAEVIRATVIVKTEICAKCKFIALCSDWLQQEQPGHENERKMTCSDRIVF
jgi:hypothetical protein